MKGSPSPPPVTSSDMMDGGRILHEAPGARDALLQNHASLLDVSEYCVHNYVQAGRRSSLALEETRRLTTQSLASVAYQINALAGSVLTLLEAQANQLLRLESSIHLIGQAVDMHRERVARREIGVFTSVQRVARVQKIVAPPPRPPRTYSRRPIDYQQLDHLGHGAKTSGRPTKPSGTIRTLGPALRTDVTTLFGPSEPPVPAAVSSFRCGKQVLLPTITPVTPSSPGSSHSPPPLDSPRDLENLPPPPDPPSNAETLPPPPDPPSNTETLPPPLGSPSEGETLPPPPDPPSNTETLPPPLGSPSEGETLPPPPDPPSNAETLPPPLGSPSEGETLPPPLDPPSEVETLPPPPNTPSEVETLPPPPDPPSNVQTLPPLLDSPCYAENLPPPGGSPSEGETLPPRLMDSPRNVETLPPPLASPVGVEVLPEAEEALHPDTPRAPESPSNPPDTPEVAQSPPPPTDSPGSLTSVLKVVQSVASTTRGRCPRRSPLSTSSLRVHSGPAHHRIQTRSLFLPSLVIPPPPPYPAPCAPPAQPPPVPPRFCLPARLEHLDLQILTPPTCLLSDDDGHPHKTLPPADPPL